MAPGFAAGWFDLGDAREQAGEREGAIEAFQKALAADPSDRQGAGLRLKLLNIGGHAMSADYVRSVFDQYASKFDEALAALSYSAPQMLLEAVSSVCGERDRPMQFGTMLDLGCGTGLSGEAFRPFVEWMEGVDLSPGMIEQARRKNLYDRLDTGDLTECLDTHSRADARFNLIVAADVFVYCADLTLIATMAADLLAEDGLFAFTVETHEGGGVVLGPKLRYAHGERHVREALEAAGLTVLRLEAGLHAKRGRCPGAGPARRRRPRVTLPAPATPPPLLPDIFARWFASRGWAPRAHQLDLLGACARRDIRPADRADRRRQDARRFSADAGRSAANAAPNRASWSRSAAICAVRRACTRSISRR